MDFEKSPTALPVNMRQTMRRKCPPTDRNVRDMILILFDQDKVVIFIYHFEVPEFGNLLILGIIKNSFEDTDRNLTTIF